MKIALKVEEKLEGSARKGSARPLLALFSGVRGRKFLKMSRHLLVPELIHILESLCTTTVCSFRSRGVRDPRSHPRGSRAALRCRILHLNFVE
jgi:hypothetical protein